MNKFFILDRDGVLIEEENYLSDPARARLCAGVPEAMKLIKEAGYGIAVTSNQSGVARGYFTMEAVYGIEKAIESLLSDAGAPVPNKWYYCPHHKKGSVAEYAFECNCRKPAPGLVLQAAEELQIDLKASFMIGDKLSDLQAAFSAGCPAGALLLTGHGSEQEIKPLEGGEYIVRKNILDAVKDLLNDAK